MFDLPCCRHCRHLRTTCSCLGCWPSLHLSCTLTCFSTLSIPLDQFSQKCLILDRRPRRDISRRLEMINQWYFWTSCSPNCFFRRHMIQFWFWAIQLLSQVLVACLSRPHQGILPTYHTKLGGRPKVIGWCLHVTSNSFFLFLQMYWFSSSISLFPFQESYFLPQDCSCTVSSSFSILLHFLYFSQDAYSWFRPYSNLMIISHAFSFIFPQNHVHLMYWYPSFLQFDYRLYFHLCFLRFHLPTNYLHHLNSQSWQLSIARFVFHQVVELFLFVASFQLLICVYSSSHSYAYHFVLHQPIITICIFLMHFFVLCFQILWKNYYNFQVSDCYSFGLLVMFVG